VHDVAPELLAVYGVGVDTAAVLLTAAGDNPDRLRSEAAFARLCGVAPLPASSGKTTNRHRLNRSGDRQANQALWRIVMTRMRFDPRTRAYVDRRTKEGLSKREVMRVLKRYVAREIYRFLPRAELPGCGAWLCTTLTSSDCHSSDLSAPYPGLRPRALLA